MDVPGGRSGHDTDTPRRLTRRQKIMPMTTRLPPLKRMLSRGSRSSTLKPAGVTVPALSHTQSGPLSSPEPAPVRMSPCMPDGFTNMSYDTWRVPSESSENPTQSSLNSESRRRMPVLILPGSGSLHRKAT